MRLAALGTNELTWRRLDVLLRHLPPGCALHRAQTDDTLGWGLTEQLLALIADALHIANWQRSGDKKIPRPRPIPRPGVSEQPEEDTVVSSTIGTARPVEEIRSIFGLPSEAAANDDDAG